MKEEEAVQEALKMVNRQLREGRRTPRRHQRFAILIVMPLAFLLLFIVLVLFGGRQ